MGFLTFGNISRDLGEADHFAGLIADGIDDDRCPETASVLADSPSFGAEAAFSCCDAQGALWKPIGAVIWRIEGCERLADDFVGRVALQPLGTGVPAADCAVEVDHVDGVINDCVDEQLKARSIVDPVKF